MSLPNRPPLSDPIPNPSSFDYPRQYTVKGPYWDMLIGENLEVGSVGELTYPDGIGEGNGSVILSGTWWPMGVGSGLTVDQDDKLSTLT